MFRGTRNVWLVLGYLYYLLESGECETTLMQIALVVNLKYATVRGIINRLSRGDYITSIRYVDRVCEDGSRICPHVLVSLKGHSRELGLLLGWLNEDFELKEGEEL